MIPSIYDRVHARRDLDGMRASKDIPGLIDALNAESVLTPFPIHVTALQIIGIRPQRQLLLDLLTDAANGIDVSERARALMSAAGAATTEDRLDPPLVTWDEVISSLYNDDGSEK